MTAIAPSSQRFSVVADFKQFADIIYALMMHDIKNRFFGSGLGQIVMILWPFVHILTLIIVYVVTKRPAPYGESLIQYSAISIFPFICFSYVSRWIVISAITNKPFLNYPIIKPLDILIARALLEIVSISIVGFLLIILVAVCGYEVMPSNPSEAVYAVLATILLAVGMGVLNGVIAFIIPIWNIFVTLVVILIYVCSGILFVTASLPDDLRYYASYNPVLHCVEWFRIAYYSDYPTIVLDRSYVCIWGLAMLTLGLVLMKLLRRLM